MLYIKENHRLHCLLQVVEDADGSVMDSFTLHKPVGWRSRSTDRLERWEKSMLGLAGTSGHNHNFTSDAALPSEPDRADSMHNGNLYTWVHGILKFIRKHRSNMLHQFLSSQRPG